MKTTIVLLLAVMCFSGCGTTDPAEDHSKEISAFKDVLYDAEKWYLLDKDVWTNGDTVYSSPYGWIVFVKSANIIQKWVYGYKDKTEIRETHSFEVNYSDGAMLLPNVDDQYPIPKNRIIRYSKDTVFSDTWIMLSNRVFTP